MACSDAGAVGAFLLIVSEIWSVYKRSQWKYEHEQLAAVLLTALLHK